MDLAINLARDRIGLTGLNPPVGCLIVKNNEIISTGQTGLNGRPHAEYNAINNKKRNIYGSTLYATMEPCTHHGLTPPCTSQILKSKIKKVIYAIDDIDYRTSKKAYSLLKSKKIIVKKNLLKNKAIKLYKKYFISVIWNIAINSLFENTSSFLACTNDYANFCSFNYCNGIWVETIFFNSSCIFN